MKTQQEIEAVHKKCVDSDGYVSPSIIEALEWVLDIDEYKSLERELKDLDNCECNHYRMSHKHDGENHIGKCEKNHWEKGILILCPCLEFKEK